MLDLRDLTKIYPNGQHALERFSLSVPHGEITAVIGGSGCGKSTLLRLVSGLETPTRGKVSIDGETVIEPHPRINMIFQEPRLLPWLTVAGNVGFGLADLDRTARDEIVASGLARVGLSDYAERWPKELSGGQAQRVAIARALVVNPEVLLLDEPFSALDAFTRADLQDHLLDIWAASKPTMIIVTHDIDEALFLARRIVIMQPSPGRIMQVLDIDLPERPDRHSPAFGDIRQHLRQLLHRSLGKLPSVNGSALKSVQG
ncbi:sulfonate transport system ATP-binding protein [Pararhizobium capsulatum DSM 1112]|uniref:Sulfonate transport system ATP-binding protein n=1 Tax=Pararhizobium capsulatum DSM 1112 TaxID=1121113 RepID=A0ABU0BTV7_9HYPH|nr:ABC transporter ATP-binding protein [Pararhizobium capsulatum]MDQ0321676.1 sulfonate transport system ATP-binding protein [Pararhizobium capsulatum DSM 1112]